MTQNENGSSASVGHTSAVLAWKVRERGGMKRGLRHVAKVLSVPHIVIHRYTVSRSHIDIHQLYKFYIIHPWHASAVLAHDGTKDCCSAVVSPLQDLNVSTKNGGKVLLDGVSGEITGGLCAVMVSLSYCMTAVGLFAAVSLRPRQYS